MQRTRVDIMKKIKEIKYETGKELGSYCSYTKTYKWPVTC